VLAAYAKRDEAADGGGGDGPGDAASAAA
jgi:hypothetical protein